MFVLIAIWLSHSRPYKTLSAGACRLLFKKSRQNLIEKWRFAETESGRKILILQCRASCPILYLKYFLINYFIVICLFSAPDRLKSTYTRMHIQYTAKTNTWLTSLTHKCISYSNTANPLHYTLHFLPWRLVIYTIDRHTLYHGKERFPTLKPPLLGDVLHFS